MIAISVAYYFFVFLPKKEAARSEEQQQQRIAQANQQASQAKSEQDKQVADQLVSDSDLQSKCAVEAETFFVSQKNSMLNYSDYIYRSHWNKSLNKCFIELTSNNYHAKIIFDAVENKGYGIFGGSSNSCVISPDGISETKQICSAAQFTSYENSLMSN